MHNIISKLLALKCEAFPTSSHYCYFQWSLVIFRFENDANHIPPLRTDEQLNPSKPQVDLQGQSHSRLQPNQTCRKNNLQANETTRNPSELTLVFTS